MENKGKLIPPGLPGECIYKTADYETGEMLKLSSLNIIVVIIDRNIAIIMITAYDHIICYDYYYRPVI